MNAAWDKADIPAALTIGPLGWVRAALVARRSAS